MAASTYLLEGKTVAPTKAQAAGIIDQVEENPMNAAREWVLNAKEADLVKPWDQKRIQKFLVEHLILRMAL